MRGAEHLRSRVDYPGGTCPLTNLFRGNFGAAEQIRYDAGIRPVSQRICSGPRICSAGIYSLADLFRISRKSANLFRMGNGRCFFDTGATRVKVSTCSILIIIGASLVALEVAYSHFIRLCPGAE